jgi:hypothetical protein
MSNFQADDRSPGRMVLPRHLDSIESARRTRHPDEWGEIPVPFPAPVKASVARLKAIETKIRTYTQNHGH